MERIVFQAGIVDVTYGRNSAQTLREFHRVRGFEAVTGLQILQAEGLHICHVRGHISAEVEQYLLHARRELLPAGIVDYEAAYSGSAA